jgi:alkyldihydroxyacetonephosphate synthase
VPRSAAGPDLRRLLVGSEGTLAVITEVTLACRPCPAGWQWLAFGFDSFGALAEGLRGTVQAQVGAVFARGYDETDAAFGFGALGHQGGCVALLGFPAGENFPAGDKFPAGDSGLDKAREVLRQANPTGELGPEYGEHWWAHRNDAVGLYASIMGPERAFGPGVVVDTAEVAGLWSAVPRLYHEIREALAGHCEAVACHLSHLYRSGSSLYFTFLVRGADDRDAEAHYLAAWDQAMRRCTAAGGTITHHHGVGRLKSAYLTQELGETGADMLRRIKAALDPGDVLNPGVLCP